MKIEEKKMYFMYTIFYFVIRDVSVRFEYKLIQTTNSDFSKWFLSKN